MNPSESGAARPEASVDLAERVVELTRGRRVAVPPYPAVALRLHEVIGRPSFSVSDVVEVVSADQTLTATVLRAANSVLFSNMGAATTLQQAVSRLGAAEVARLALAAGLADSMKTPGALQALRRQTWVEGVASASICHALARLRGLSQRDAFTCGLLHDFGRMVAIAALEQVLRDSADAAARPEASWKESLDRVTPELNALVASIWNLPPLLQQAMTLRGVHARSRSMHAPLLELIAIGDSIVELMLESSHVSAYDLSRVPGLRPAEWEPLAELLPSVPATINAFEAERPPKPAPSKLIAPATSLGGEPLRALELPISQLQPARRGPFQLAAINNAGWVMSSDTAFPERQLWEATIAMPDSAAPLKFWASTTACRQEQGSFRIECKPFALDRDGKRRWAELVALSKA